MESSSQKLPLHVGIIMDGNGRWATGRNLPRKSGHKKGAEVFEKIAIYARDIGIRHLSVFAFSTENFSRPQDEVDAILDLMRSYLKNQKRSQNKDVRVRFLGDISVLPNDMKEDIQLLEDSSKQYTKLNLNIAFNYGGRQDILQGAKQLADKYHKGEVSLDLFSEEDFGRLLYSRDQPEIDLLIRTSGEERISNFMLWQTAYAEFVFLPTLWPDFSPKHLDEALEIYYSRHRRKGGL